jgi:hypothetical protein
MKRLALVAALSSCAFATKHPGITVGLAAGSIGFVGCELNVERHGTCALIGGTVGLVLGGIAGLVTLLADTGDHQLHLQDPPEPPIIRRKSRPAEPPPDPTVPEPAADPAVEPETADPAPPAESAPVLSPTP